MALPITITGLLANAASIETSTQPFVYNDAVYVFGRGTTGNQLRAFKCTDADTGSFSNVGSDITTNGDVAATKGIQLGDEVFVVTIDGDDIVAALRLRLHIFNTSSDTWTTTNEAIVTDYTNTSFASPKHLGLGIRSDGDLIVLYNGPVVNIGGADRETVYYARRESGSWTVNVQVSNAGSNNWFSGSVVVDANDRTYFFFINDTAADAFQRCLTSANSLQSFPSSYDATIAANEESAVAIGISYNDAGTIRVRYPCADNGTATIKSIKFDSADTPTISVDADITGALNAIGGANRKSMSALGTDLYHVFVDSASDIYYQSNADDAGWSSNTLFLTGTCNGLKTTIYVREGNYKLAILYNNSTTPIYNEIDLGSAVTFASGAFDSDATAAVTWGGTSTATSAFDSDATAAVTWNGRSFAASAFDQDATALLTWTGQTINISAAAFDSDAAASMTWNGRSFASAAYDSDATAALTWNGVSFAASAFDSDAAASLTWNGRSFAASSLSVTTAANLIWNGRSFASAAFDSDAIATLTWNGAQVASGAFDSDGTALLIWEGSSGASSAALTSAATALLVWNGTSIASSNFDADAAGALSWNGSASASASWDSDAVTSLTWNGTAVAGAAFDSDALATLTWTGAFIVGASPAALESSAVSTVTFAAETIAEASFEMDAVAMVVWKGEGPGALRRNNIDGPRPRRRRNQDDEDLPFIMAAIYSVLEQDHGNH